MAVEVWILAVVLERGARPKLSAHPTEQACVTVGKAWEREAAALRKRMKQLPPTGWLCTTTEERPS